MNIGKIGITAKHRNPFFASTFIWYGFKHGSSSFQGNQYIEVNEKLFHSPNIDVPSTQKELAESYGITQQTMNNYMRMANMIPELEDLVDTGIVTKDTALAIIKNLSNDEQRELISSMDITKKITKKEAKKYIEERHPIIYVLNRIKSGFVLYSSVMFGNLIVKV